MPSTEPPVSRFERGASVWVVDDSPMQLELARTSLQRHAEVRTFNGAAPMLEALAMEAAPAVVVLDWNMPDISGLEACRSVRATFASSELPIVILTASGRTEDVVEALDAGANDFLRKPIDPVELDARVAALAHAKRLHDELLQAKAALHDEATFREQFLAILAHDLRQPLNTFALGGEALGAADLPPALRKRTSNQLMRAADRMQRMITELLDFSRARPRGGMPIAPREMDIVQVAKQVVEEIQLVHGASSIELAGADDCRGTWDADRLAQVVSNLVENAVAHRTPGSIVHVSVGCSPGFAHFAVENVGEPISTELLPKLFDPFKRGARPASGSGLGLGLFIASQIVKAHGGTIAARSTDGRTSFEVALPVVARSPTPLP